MTFLKGSQTLRPDDVAYPRRAGQELDIVLPQLDERATPYFARLREIVSVLLT